MRRSVLIALALVALAVACGEEEEYRVGELVVNGGMPNWGNNGLIAYSNTQDIYTCDEYGGNITNVTEGRHVSTATDPAWSPDCKYIVYSAFREENMKCGLFIIPVAGGEPRLLAEEGERPAWSPDGEWVAYVAPAGNNPTSLWVIPAEGGTPKCLTSEYYVWALAWTPGGESLVFAGYDKAKGMNLWLIKPVGGAVIMLTEREVKYFSRGPSVRRDGEWILFSNYPPYGPADIWAFNAKTKEFVRVTRVWEGPCAGASEPCWSPDGRRVGYTYGDAIYKIG